MTANALAKRGDRPAWSREPFEPGNRAAAKSAFYVTALAVSERDEVQTIADAIGALSPLNAEAQEPLVQLVLLRSGDSARRSPTSTRLASTRSRAPRLS
jgi:hypothetical protein